MARKYSSISIEQLLNASLGAGDTTLALINSAAVTSLLGGVTLGAAVGGVYPDQFTVAIDPDTASEEIVFVRATSGNQLTNVLRGQAGTSATTHTAGATIKHVLTSDDLTAFATAISPVTNVQFAGSTSGSTTVQATAVAGTTTLTLPAATDTVVGRATTDTLTNKTINLTSNTLVATSAQLATAVTDETGSGALVFGTSPTIATPVITVGYSTPSFSSNAYTLVLADQGKVLLASNSTTAGTIYVPTDASQPYPTGTQITIIQTGTGQLTITAANSGATSILSNGTTAGSPKCRTRYSAVTLVKYTTNGWYVIGDLV